MGVNWKQYLDKPEFPRSAKYDPAWMAAGSMGPNAVWLVEWLAQAMQLRPDMRVLDLGCGKALTSIFLAKEFGVRVWAGDLWVDPEANWQRIVEAGVANHVCPIRLEAHSLPFACGYFDAIISIDSYTYFGTDDLYLRYLAHYLTPGGAIGVVMPGLTQEMPDPVPDHLANPQSNGKKFWEDESVVFHTADWWRRHWEKAKVVAIDVADVMPDGWRHWRDFELALEQTGHSPFPSDAEALTKDGGEYIGLVRLVARRNDTQAMNLYDPHIMHRMGIPV